MKVTYRGIIGNIRDNIVREYIKEVHDYKIKWLVSKKGNKYSKYDNGSYIYIFFKNEYVIIYKREKYEKEEGDLSF